MVKAPGDGYNREEYVARINRVIDYIESNIGEELNLAKLSRVASFSPFHFHRIFRGLVGEPLSKFIQRVRLEKAANALIDNPRKSVTELALDFGFSGSSAFARAFKERFRMSASEWRRKRKIGDVKSKGGHAKRNAGKASLSSSRYTGGTTHRTRRKEMKKSAPFDVEVRHVPEMHVAYVRHIGPYKGESALFERLFAKLFKWAGARDLLRFPHTKVLAVYHDNPDVTDESRLRTSVCITVPEDTKVEGEVGKMVIPSGKYAVAHFEIGEDGYEEAWNALYGGWLPDSGYQPDDRPCFEVYLNDPKEHPDHTHIVDIYLPVKPL